MTYSSSIYGPLTHTTAKKVWTLMLKQLLVSQLYTNYITKYYFTNGLLFHDHILKFHYFFMTFST